IMMSFLLFPQSSIIFWIQLPSLFHPYIPGNTIQDAAFSGYVVAFDRLNVIARKYFFKLPYYRFIFFQAEGGKYNRVFHLQEIDIITIGIVVTGIVVYVVGYSYVVESRIVYRNFKSVVKPFFFYTVIVDHYRMFVYKAHHAVGMTRKVAGLLG